MKIQIDVDSGAVQRALSRLGESARNLTPAFREIGEGIKSDAQLRFKDSKDPYGKAWAALKASTLAARRKGKGSGSAKPLLDTGRLRNSIASRLLSNGVEVGTNVKYAAIHNFGGQAGRGRKTTIAQRAYIATQERGIPREYGEIIRDALNRHFGRAAS